jgi:hypothetical protein
VKPSVGRIVHYVSYGTPGGEHERIGVAVLNPSGMFFHDDLPELDPAAHGYRGGTWHWPEREPSGDAPKVQVNADLSPQQVKQITGMIQASLLQQAKRSRR